MHVRWPAEKFALHLHGERVGQRVHQLDFFRPGQRGNLRSGNAPANRGKGGHALRREIGLDQLTVSSVLRRVHAVGHR